LFAPPNIALPLVWPNTRFSLDPILPRYLAHIAYMLRRILTTILALAILG
jgi:hypothetical protein